MKRFYSLITAAALCISAAMAADAPHLLSNGLANAPQRSLPVPHITMEQARKALAAPKAPVEWSEWEEVGTGTFTMDDTFPMFTGLDEWQGDFPGKSVTTHYNLADPNDIQYCLHGLFNNCDIIVNYDATTGLCRVPMQATGIDFYGDELVTCDFATAYEVLYADNPDYSPEELQEIIDYYAAYNYFLQPIGRFYLFLCFTWDWYDDAVAMSDTEFQIDNMPTGVPTISTDRFVAPGAGTIKADITLEEGIPSARVAVATGLPSNQQLQALLNGDLDIVEINGSGEVEIPIPAELNNKLLNLIAITYDNLGQALDFSQTFVTVVDVEEGAWETLGDASFTTDILNCLFDAAPQTYDAQLDRNIANPALYRLVNAHGIQFQSPVQGSYDDSFPHYIYLDATDPDCVLMPMFDMGITVGGGAVAAGGVACYRMDTGKTFEEVKEAGLGGTFDGNTISFAKNTVVLYGEDMTSVGLDANSIYFTNTSGEFKVVLPAMGIESVSASTSAPEYYNLQGIRVAVPQPGSFLIRRTGDKVEKVFVK